MRRQLALVVAATTSIVILAFLVPLALLVRTVAYDRALDTAEVEAQSLATVLATVPDETAVALAVDRLVEGSARSYTVFLPGGSVVGDPATARADLALARSGRSFSVTTSDGRAFYLPVALGAGEPAVVRVFVPDRLLTQGVARAWLLLAGLGVALLLFAVLVADWLGRSIVRATRSLATTAQDLEDGRLDSRVTPSGPPELATLSRTMNRLAGRIGELVAAEREAVADLSHRLRTPVAALRLDVEALPDSTEAHRLAADVDALERTVDALIRDARRPVRPGFGRGCDAVEVTRERVAFWAPLAEDQGRTVEVDLPDEPVPVPVAAEDLAAALDAVLGNVVAHTPEGTPFEVKVDPAGRVVVADAGPGLPARDLLGRGHSGAGSTGLGLDIARRTAESGGGRLVLGASPSGGAQVVLDLAAAAPPRD